MKHDETAVSYVLFFAFFVCAWLASGDLLEDPSIGTTVVPCGRSTPSVWVTMAPEGPTNERRRSTYQGRTKGQG